MPQAVPEILYFRCPQCSKRFPGNAFKDVAAAECQYCQTLVDSPHAPPPRQVAPLAPAARVAPEVPAAQSTSASADVTERLRKAFAALSQDDQHRFLNQTLTFTFPAVPEDTSSWLAPKARLVGAVLLLAIGLALLSIAARPSSPSSLAPSSLTDASQSADE